MCSSLKPQRLRVEQVIVLLLFWVAVRKYAGSRKEYWKTATVAQSHSSWMRMWPPYVSEKSDSSALHAIFELRRSINSHGVVYRANDSGGFPGGHDVALGFQSGTGTLKPDAPYCWWLEMYDVVAISPSR
ncbi:uncharacterized protein AKAW2_10363S [Aspergillus luchuensis]|uniref:Uncharacterized protein n=1 Tax=Aspergillus kawachii TaxID=1069201 RepID=A0A7R7ZUA2_ASPKA|nr:uncharacterized protein AKAW2_10363S [Aspergillus luchuensis]BCR93317.1 hypothetical protein AKAW2_10363S [Aspergillus luchuensis]